MNTLSRDRPILPCVKAGQGVECRLSTWDQTAKRLQGVSGNVTPSWLVCLIKVEHIRQPLSNVVRIESFEYADSHDTKRLDMFAISERLASESVAFKSLTTQIS